jgi:ligand-binding sensor domain-containing protein
VVWIATWGGVLAWNRTDEYVYRRYSSEHGLVGTPSCIAVASDDRPWVGHTEGGLSWFDAGRWHPYEHLRHDPILAIAAARDGCLWVATPDAIALVARGERPVEIVRGDGALATAASLLSDGDGVLVGSPWGLYRVAERSPKARVHEELVSECTALARTAKGTLVIGTPAGVIVGDTRIGPHASDASVVSVAPSHTGMWVLPRGERARVENGEWMSLGRAPDGIATPRVLAVTRPNDDYVWIGTDDLMAGARPSGDSPWDAGVLPNHAEDVLSNLGRCAVGDGDGRVWIGTSGGLFVGEPDGTWSFDSEPGDVRSVMVATRKSGDDAVWVLGWPTGVSRITMPGRVQEPIALPAGLPRALVRGHDWRPFAWVGDAVWRLDGERPKVEALRVPAHTRILIPAPPESWYAGTDRGLFRYTPIDGIWALEPAFGISNISALAHIAVWSFAGTNGAFWMHDARGWRKLPLQHDGRKWTEPVTALAGAHTRLSDSIWLACGGRVARCSTEDGTVIEVYDRFDSGVCGDTITAIVETQGILWVASRAGIARHVLQR